MAEQRSDQRGHEAASADAQDPLNAALASEEDIAEPDSHYRYELVLRRAAEPQPHRPGADRRRDREQP
jgi:hypothetical protein